MKKYQYEDPEFGTIILYLHPTARHLIFKIRDNSLQKTEKTSEKYTRARTTKYYVRELCSNPGIFLLPYKHITKTNTCSSYTTIFCLYFVPTRQSSNLPRHRKSYLPESNVLSSEKPKNICRNASIY